MAKAKNVRTFEERTTTARELSPEVVAAVRDLVKGGAKVAGDLQSAVDRDSKALLTKYLNRHEAELTRLAGLAHSLARQVG